MKGEPEEISSEFLECQTYLSYPLDDPKPAADRGRVEMIRPVTVRKILVSTEPRNDIDR